MWRGLMNGRQMNKTEPLGLLSRFPVVDTGMKLILPSIINLSSSALSIAALNHPVDISAGRSITTGWHCSLLCSAALAIQGEIFE